MINFIVSVFVRTVKMFSNFLLIFESNEQKNTDCTRCAIRIWFI